MERAAFERWAADYVKTISWAGEEPESRRRKQHDKVVAQRAEALRFLRERGAEARLDELAGDPPEVTLLTFTIRAEDEELGVALVHAGASTTRIFAAPSRADDGPIHVFERPSVFARRRGLAALAAALATPEALAVEAEDERRRRARSPGPNARFANVWATKDRWIFLPQSGIAGDASSCRGIPGVTIRERASAPADVAEQLRATIALFSLERADPAGVKRMQREQLSACGVKKESALYAAVRLVSISSDGEKLVLTRWLSQKSGFMPTTDAVPLEDPFTDEALVAALDRATADPSS
jgi:hypothetical protein